jgi:prophage regulatory protein
MKFLGFSDLKSRGIPYTRMHLRRLEAAGSFPHHVDIGDNSIAWVEEEIDAWCAERIAKRDARIAGQEPKIPRRLRGKQAAVGRS